MARKYESPTIEPVGGSEHFHPQTSVLTFFFYVLAILVAYAAAAATKAVALIDVVEAAWLFREVVYKPEKKR